LGSEKVIKSFETSSPLSSIKKGLVGFWFSCKARSIPANLFLMWAFRSKTDPERFPSPTIDTGMKF
jgi:hypothetical protein